MQPNPQRARGINLLLLVVSTLLFAGCAVSTPGCDSAGGMLDGAQLDDAAIAYASADMAGEGDCASSGLAAVVAAHRDVAIAIARGIEAERRQDRDAALAAYRTAVEIDSGSTAAGNGLRRLGAESPQLRPVEARPAASTATLVVPWWPFALAGIMLVVALAAAAWWAVAVVRTGRDAANVHASLGHARAEVAAIRSDLGLSDPGGQAGTAAERLAALGERLRDLQDAVADLARDGASKRDSLERQIDDVAEQLDDLGRDAPRVARRYFVRGSEDT